MKIIFATEPIKYPLTGIGRYSLELVKRLAVAREIEELKLFHGASFIDQIPQVENKSDSKASNHGRLSAFLVILLKQLDTDIPASGLEGGDAG